MNTMTDDELVELVQQGDNEDAFQELYIAHNSAVSKWITKLLLDHNLPTEMLKETSEDVAQETWFRAWRDINKFKGKSSFETWVCGIARNVVREWLRENYNPGTGTSYDSVDNVDSTRELSIDPEQVEKLILDESAKVLVEAINAALSPQQREIYRMKLLGLKNKEIAEILGKTPNLVHSQLSQARTRFRDIIQEHYGPITGGISSEIKKVWRICIDHLEQPLDEGEES